MTIFGTYSVLPLSLFNVLTVIVSQVFHGKKFLSLILSFTLFPTG